MDRLSVFRFFEIKDKFAKGKKIKNKLFFAFLISVLKTKNKRWISHKCLEVTAVFWCYK